MRDERGTMITVKVYFHDGDYLVSRINCCLREAIEYYLGNWFNLGPVKDNMKQAVKVVKL